MANCHVRSHMAVTPAVFANRPTLPRVCLSEAAAEKKSQQCVDATDSVLQLFVDGCIKRSACFAICAYLLRKFELRLPPVWLCIVQVILARWLYVRACEGPPVTKAAHLLLLSTTCEAELDLCLFFADSDKVISQCQFGSYET